MPVLTLVSCVCITLTERVEAKFKEIRLRAGADETKAVRVFCYISLRLGLFSGGHLIILGLHCNATQLSATASMTKSWNEGVKKVQDACRKDD